jgi:hypothetical protein
MPNRSNVYVEISIEANGFSGIGEVARSILQMDQRFPSVTSQTKGLQVNPDGSVDVHFGPKPPPGKESNWVQTIPDQGWNTLLRPYSSLEPCFNKTWRPGEVELVP